MDSRGKTVKTTKTVIARLTVSGSRRRRELKATREQIAGMFKTVGSCKT